MGDFSMIKSPWKVFANIKGATHNAPLLRHTEGPFIAYASQYFALGNKTAGQKIYGNGPGSLSESVDLAGEGDLNAGEGSIGFLACGRRLGIQFAVPSAYAKYCKQKHILHEGEARTEESLLL